MGLSEKLTEIKSEVDSLITYANGVTGEADTKLGDAILALVDGYGQGGSASMFELIGETSIELDEYTGTANETNPSGIDIRNSDYSIILATVECDGTVESTYEWGGLSIALFGRYKSNSNVNLSTTIQPRGNKSLSFSESLFNTHMGQSYGVFFASNTSDITFIRKCYNATNVPRIMGGTYTVKAYGLVSLNGAQNRGNLWPVFSTSFIIDDDIAANASFSLDIDFTGFYEYVKSLGSESKMYIYSIIKDGITDDDVGYYCASSEEFRAKYDTDNVLRTKYVSGWHKYESVQEAYETSGAGVTVGNPGQSWQPFYATYQTVRGKPSIPVKSGTYTVSIYRLF